MPSLVRYGIAGHRNHFGRQSCDVADLVRGSRFSCMCTSGCKRLKRMAESADHISVRAHVKVCKCFSRKLSRKTRRRVVCTRHLVAPIRLLLGSAHRSNDVLCKICMNLSFDRLSISTLDARLTISALHVSIHRQLTLAEAVGRVAGPGRATRYHALFT